MFRRLLLAGALVGGFSLPALAQQGGDMTTVVVFSAKYESSIRRQETQHMKDGRITYTPPLAMERMVDASLVPKAAESLR
jgi:hypothetical protein